MNPNPLPAFSGYGIELEYMIVDDGTLSIKPIADLVCSDAHSTGLQDSLIGCSNEIVLHLVELKNRQPACNLAQLQFAFQNAINDLNRLLQPANARLMPSAMHPWMAPETETRLWPHQQAEIYQAYDRIFNCRRHGHANVQSMQINLPFADDAEFARLHEAVRLALPIIPALAASSPYADERWSGSLDYRLETYLSHQQRVPSTMGDLIPESVASKAEYEAKILAPMFRDIAQYDPAGILQHEWLNVRAAVPRFDRCAIEIRIADVQECPLADIAIAAAVIGLVRHFYETEAHHPAADSQLLLSILRDCLKSGEQTVIAEQRYLRLMQFPGRRCTATELWQHLLTILQREGGIMAQWLPPLQFILEHGTLASRLLQAVGVAPQHDRLHAAYLMLCECLERGRMFEGLA